MRTRAMRDGGQSRLSHQCGSCGPAAGVAGNRCGASAPTGGVNGMRRAWAGSGSIGNCVGFISDGSGADTGKYLAKEGPFTIGSRRSRPLDHRDGLPRSPGRHSRAVRRFDAGGCRVTVHSPAVAGADRGAETRGASFPVGQSAGALPQMASSPPHRLRRRPIRVWRTVTGVLPRVGACFAPAGNACPNNGPAAVRTIRSFRRIHSSPDSRCTADSGCSGRRHDRKTD